MNEVYRKTSEQLKINRLSVWADNIKLNDDNYNNDLQKDGNEEQPVIPHTPYTYRHTPNTYILMLLYKIYNIRQCIGRK